MLKEVYLRKQTLGRRPYDLFSRLVHLNMKDGIINNNLRMIDVSHSTYNTLCEKHNIKKR